MGRDYGESQVIRGGSRGREVGASLRMPAPPQCVKFVARTHWTVGTVVVVATALVAWAARNVPRIEFGPRTYVITGTLAAVYFLAGTLVWLGAPFGPLLSRVCSLLYLPRPQFGSYIWETMNSPEFRAHFRRGSGTNTAKPS